MACESCRYAVVNPDKLNGIATLASHAREELLTN